MSESWNVTAVSSGVGVVSVGCVISDHTSFTVFVPELEGGFVFLVIGESVGASGRFSPALLNHLPSRRQECLKVGFVPHWYPCFLYVLEFGWNDAFAVRCPKSAEGVTNDVAESRDVLCNEGRPCGDGDFEGDFAGDDVGGVA